MDSAYFYDALFDYVEELVPMPDCDKERCRETFVPIVVKKDTIIEKAGNVPIYHNFIVSGHMRNFYLNAEFEEITIDINEGPRFFTSYMHFVNQTVSNENIQCITDCELLRITKEDVLRSEADSLSLKDFSIKLFLRVMEEEKQKHIDKNTLTADQRYQKFIESNPNIHMNVPLKYVASYLGITQRHLSRLRSL
jgi:CRP/FNR family transcriptional regulator, anaerobic regulatory protein